MDDLEKQYGTFSRLLQALCISSQPAMFSNCPETPNLDQNPQFFVRWDLEICWMILKTIGHLSYASPGFVHHLVDICKFKLELRSGNPQIGTKFVLTSVILTIDLWY